MSRQQNDAERTKAETTALARQYREIGPAAIVAALLCAAKKADEKTDTRKAA